MADFLARRWKRQPQGPVEVANEWRDRGLISCLLPSMGAVDVVDQKPFTVVGSLPTRVSGAPGIGFKFDGASGLVRGRINLSVDTATQLAIFAPSRLTADEVIVGTDRAGDYSRHYLFFVGRGLGDPYFAGTRNNANAGSDAASGMSGAAVGKVQTVLGQYSSGTSRSIWIDGTKKNTNATSVSGIDLDYLSYGCAYLNASPDYYTNGTLFLAWQFSSGLSDASAEALQRDPWQIFKPRRAFIYSFLSGGGDETAALTGASSASGAGTLASVQSVAVAGSEATAEAGTLTALIEQALAGSEATIGAGTVAPVQAVVASGSEVSADAGSLAVADRSVAVVGEATIASAGSFGALSAFALAGSEVESTPGFVAIAAAFGLTGLEISVSGGTITPVTGTAPLLTLAGVQDITATSARPKVTLTF